MNIHQEGRGRVLYTPHGRASHGYTRVTGQVNRYTSNAQNKRTNELTRLGTWSAPELEQGERAGKRPQTHQLIQHEQKRQRAIARPQTRLHGRIHVGMEEIT